MFTIKYLLLIVFAMAGIYLLIRLRKSTTAALSFAPDVPVETCWYSPLKFAPAHVGWYKGRYRVAEYGTKGDPEFMVWWDGLVWRNDPDGSLCIEQSLWFRGLVEQQL